MYNDNIFSIGAVRITNYTFYIADSQSILGKNQQLQTQNAVAIHGLVQTDIKGQSEPESIAALFKFVGSDIIVGHHIAFDIAMLNKLSRKNGGGDLKNNLLDTSYLARRLDHTTDPDSLDRKEYTLDKLCSRFKVIPKARHTADGDAFITAIVFMKLIQKLYIKGVTSTGQLVRK
jgi:DNA polymerase-3 subunit epsilon